MSSVQLPKYNKFLHYEDYIFTTISGLFLVFSWFGWLESILPFDPAWISIIISGTPIIYGATIALVTRFDIKSGLLVSIALIASVIIGEYFAAGEIAFIMMIGEILEERTVLKAHEGLKKLIQLTPEVGRIRTEEGEKEIPASEIKVGDILLVKPGESIPVDGVIINGESMPINKTICDEVFVDTLNQYGVIEVKATKVGKDTSLSKLIRLVRESEQKKSPVARIADKLATLIVPLALFLAVITFFITHDATRAVTILVVFCPCALVLATPTAIVAGIGNAARNGILIKGGEVLEKIHKITAIAFDKTGTITYGKPEVTDIISLVPNYTTEEILKIAATSEKFSEHPLGKALVSKATEGSIELVDPKDFSIKLGKGIIAKVNDQKVLVGNLKLAADHNIDVSERILGEIKKHEQSGKTVMLVSVDDKIVGLINVADQIKEMASHTIKKLKKLGIENIALLTGDNQITANAIASRAKINEVYAEQLPEDKVKVFEHYINKNKIVCMIGDGINDAPALARADIGVAMGVLGSDVALETSDIALMADDISKIPDLFILSKKVFSTIKINIAISMVINIVAVILAGMGIINPSI
jgi:heavy metal translocating P-type ATPase